MTSAPCPNILAGSMQVPKVLVADPVSQRGLDEIATGGDLEVVVKTDLSEAEIIKIIPEFSALVVRSQTKVTAAVLEAAKKLKVVGRAGVGVDNVDIDAATKRGVIVMNTPGGNTISTAEHAFSLLVMHCTRHSAGGRKRQGRQMGPQEVRRRRALQQDAGNTWNGSHWNGDRTARHRFRNARHRVRSLSFGQQSTQPPGRTCRTDR